MLYGPFVLAADEALLGGKVKDIRAIAVPSTDLAALAIAPEPAPAKFKNWAGGQVFRLNAVARTASPAGAAGAPLSIRLIPFANAGATGASYKVWLPLLVP